MRLRPMPVVMISLLTTRGSKATMTALEHGAVDFLPKPEHRGAENIDSWSQQVVEKIRVAARAKLAQHAPTPDRCSPGSLCASRASSLSAPPPGHGGIASGTDAAAGQYAVDCNSPAHARRFHPLFRPATRLTVSDCGA